MSQRKQDANGDLRSGIFKQCKFCNTEFFTRKDQEKKFCSHKCSSESRKKRLPVKCDTCDSPFEIIPKRYNKSKHKKFFCSKECKLKAHRVGGSIAPEHYGSVAYRSLFESHELVCSRCGYNEFDCGIDIHHKNENRNDNRKENLIPLCSPCHRALHKGIWILT